MMMSSIVLGILGIALVLVVAEQAFWAVLCGYIARRRGRPRSRWFVVGLLLGPLSLVAIGVGFSRQRARAVHHVDGGRMDVPHDAETLRRSSETSGDLL